MNPMWAKLEQAIADITEIPPQERGAWLADFCAGDDVLRAEISSMLAFESDSENFLENSADLYAARIFEDDAGFENSILIGKQFGNYRIEREIGRGGMGAVYLAARAEGGFEQRAAIKIIRIGFDTADLRRRFRHERQILSGLEHANIARLLDGGATEDGLPFLVMEYVEGLPLNNYCAAKNLGLSDRLKLFLKICGAVGYAHQHLVVHRDLKPSNIFVTPEGEPKLLDFGIAKLLDNSEDSAVTQTHFRAFTPDYASPEQKRGEKVTTTSDIYSLGKILSELILLTRTTDSSFRQSERDTSPAGKITATDPPRVPAELRNIVDMSLREEPERRYPTVEAFAADIERYSNGLPIIARPNTFLYRAEKFVKRNYVTLMFAAVLVLTLIVGIGATLWQARRAEDQRARAEKRFGEVRQLANSLMFEIHDSVQNLEGSTATRELIVGKALNYLDSLARDSGDDAELQIDLATAYEKIGTIQGNPYSANLGDTEGALKSYNKAVSILENLHQNAQTKDGRLALGRSYRALGDILEVKGDTAGCIANYRRSLEIFEQAAQQYPDDFAARDEYARAFETLGDGLSRIGADGAAEQLAVYEKCLEIRQHLAQENPFDQKLKRSIGLTYFKIGGARGPDRAAAEADTRRAITLLEELSNVDPTNARARREVAISYAQLGTILTDAENFSAALDARRRAFQIRRESAAGDPANKQARFDLGTAYADLSEALSNTGATSEALDNARQSLIILQELADHDSNNYVYRRNVALCDEKFGEAFEQAAGKEQLSAAEKIKNWSSAREWYQKTLDAFNELRAQNILQPRDNSQFDRISAKIADCTESIARLRPAR
jgi:eukaryotic-like serine/threonine-protein kinase